MKNGSVFSFLFEFKQDLGRDYCGEVSSKKKRKILKT